MGDIQKKEQVSSFDKKLKKAVGLFDALTNTDSILLLDTSGSMDRRVEGVQLIDHLKNAVKEYEGEYEMVEFSDGAELVTDLDGLLAGGGTDLVAGLEVCKNLNAISVMLVSDGRPDNPQGAINYCLSHGIKVNSMFIGNNPQGLMFMNRISELTGGKYVGNVDKGIEGFGLKMISTVRGLIECNEEGK